jgi:hypothetical protein
MQVFHDAVKRFSWSSFAALLAVSMLCAGQADARPLTPAETRQSPYDGSVPGCGDPDVFSRIQSHFSQTEGEYWHSGLEILGFNKIDEIGYRTNGTDYIPRRYCVAEAMMNDQKARTVSYSIGQDLGIIGFFGFGVEWCVAGLDRERSYAPNCKMARP